MFFHSPFWCVKAGMYAVMPICSNTWSGRSSFSFLVFLVFFAGGFLDRIPFLGGCFYLSFLLGGVFCDGCDLERIGSADVRAAVACSFRLCWEQRCGAQLCVAWCVSFFCWLPFNICWGRHRCACQCCVLSICSSARSLCAARGVCTCIPPMTSEPAGVFILSVDGILLWVSVTTRIICPPGSGFLWLFGTLARSARQYVAFVI